MQLNPSNASLKRAKKFAKDYQDRNLIKCVFERILTSKTQFAKIKAQELKTELATKSRVDENDIFIDTSSTPSIPLSPSKKESKRIILIGQEGGKKAAKEINISEIPLVSAMAGYMNILRVYTTKRNRKKVEIAAISRLGDLE